MSRWERAGLVGAYVACAVVLWRMASWEQAIARWVKHGQAVFDRASGDLASAATDLHEEAVARDASSN